MEPVITENSYICKEFSIVLEEVRRNNTDIYVADIVLSDASYLRAGLAGGVFGRNISGKTSKIAEENGAILAVNGDYYGFRDQGFVMRNGYLYRGAARTGKMRDALVVYGDGTLAVADESETTAEELMMEGAVHIFSFGPGLISDGEITVDKNTEVEYSLQSNPRTAIGQIGPLHYVLIVSDGRTGQSAGLTLYELAQFMEELGCETAYNLDGGGSSTMWFMGKVINVPSDWGAERSVSDIVYIGKE